jgi:hypothetical protein
MVGALGAAYVEAMNHAGVAVGHEKPARGRIEGEAAERP